MKKSLFLLISLFILSCKNSHKEAIIWRINSTSEIGGNSTISWRNPTVISGKGGDVVEFDGQKDGLLINENPLSGMDEFTIEVDFKPYEGFPENKEQQFLHIQDPGHEDRRILIELRLNDRNQWYGDWFIKTENESLTLIDSAQTHLVDEWATISMFYQNGLLKGFVNGREELSGKIRYLPISKNGKPPGSKGL